MRLNAFPRPWGPPQKGWRQRDKDGWFTGVPGPPGRRRPQWGWPGFQVPPGGRGRDQEALGAHPFPVLALLKILGPEGQETLLWLLGWRYRCPFIIPLGAGAWLVSDEKCWDSPGCGTPGLQPQHWPTHRSMGTQEESQSGLLLWVKPVETRPGEGEGKAGSRQTFPSLLESSAP